MRVTRVAALAVFLVACSQREDATTRGVPLIAVGDSQYARGAFDSAGATYRRALEDATTRGTPNEARLLSNLSMVAYRQNEYATARSLADSALALKQRYQMGPKEVADSRNLLGLVAWNEGRLADATALYEQAIAEFTAAHDSAGVAKASSNLGNIVLEYGRFADAKRLFEAARETAHRLGDARMEGRVITNLAMLELWSGDPRLTVTLVAEARRLAALAHDAVNEENALVQVALGYAALGEPGRAIATVDTAIAIARRHGLREEEAADRVVLAGLYASAGDVDRALNGYSAARELYEELELPVEVATVERQESVLRAARGAVTQGRAGLRRALTTHRKSEARFESLRDLLALARVETDDKQFDAAARWLEEIDRELPDYDGSYVRVAVAVERARLFDTRGDARSTLRTLSAIADELDVADTQSSLDAEWLRMRSFVALHEVDSAVTSARRAAAIIERTSDGFSSLALRVGYVGERHRVLSDIVLTLLRAGVAEEALRIAASGRGQALRAQLARVRTAVGSAARATTSAALAERERLLREIDALVARLAEIQQQRRSERGAEWPETNTELIRRIRAARSAYEGLVLRQIEGAADPRRESLVSAPTADIASVRASLASDEAIVELYPTRDTLVIFALTRAHLRVLTLGTGVADIESRVRLVRGLLSGPGRGNASRPALEGLHGLLIRPLELDGALVGVRRLLVVPHGILSYLPFPALRNPRTQRALAQEYVVERIPAATMLPALRRGTSSRPVDRTTVFSPFPDRLPATRLEADALSRMTPNAPAYRGTAATEARLRQALATDGVVHVASHATFNGANPMFSGIVLARGSGSSGDDGRLEVHEVLDLPVRSELVFLSGCETALGAARTTAFAPPEDATTLGDAFLLAGARGVIATLWRIDDEGAAQFALRFYRHLANNDPAEALAMAQREMMTGSRWDDPYYWAAYTLSGDGPYEREKE